MSRIRRLGISGIRNFGPGDEEKEIQTIHFSYPLSLILGPNGTGKTTIIESLKYITTGEFPPGSGIGKSNSFIHDPLLTNESAVRGLVKAELVDAKGDIVTVSRRIECTQRKFVKKFQTLDSTLSRHNKITGEKSAISHRCADLDHEIGLVLGVSKPILNYVIFCHQEDSTWPLEDGKKLKERFDQIFDSDKYNKAVESVRKYIKNLRVELRVSKSQKDSFKLILEETNEKQKSLNKFENRLTVSKQKVTQVMDKIEPINVAIKELTDTEMRYMKLHTEKETKKTEFGLLKKQITELQNNIQVIHEGTAEELEKEIAAFDAILTEKESEMAILRNKLKEIIKDENKLKVTIGDKQLSIGKLKQQTQALEKNISVRNRNLNEMLVEFGLTGVGDEISETDAALCLNNLKDKLSDMERSIKDTALEQQAVEGQLQKELDGLRDQKSKLESGIIMLRKQIAEKRQDASRLRMQVEEVSTLASQLDLVDSKLKEANANVDMLAGSFDVDSAKKKIEEEIKNRNKMESSLDKINEEVTALQLQSSQQAELELLRTALATKEKDLHKLRNKHEDFLKMLLKVEVLPRTNLKLSLDRVQESLTDQVKELNEKLQREDRELSSLETTKKHQEQELRDKNDKLGAIQDEIANLCHGKEYDEVLLYTKKTLQDLQDSKGMYAYKSVVYKDYIKKSESCCPLCHRNFDNKQDHEQFKSELNDEVNKYPHQLKMCEEKLKVEQKRYDNLLQLKPLVDQVKELEENTLKKLKQEQNKLKQKLSETHMQIEKLRAEILEPESKLAQCKDIVGDVTLWDQYSSEVSKLNQSIAALKARLPEQVSNKSMQEVQAEQELMRKSLSAARKRIEDLQLSLSSHNDKLQSARETRNKLAENQLKMTSEVQKLKQLQNKLKDLSAEEVSLQQNVSELQQQLAPFNQQLEAKSNLLRKTKKENNEVLENNRSAVAEKSKSLHALKSVQSEIESCIRRGVVESLRKSESDMKKYQQMINELEKNKNEVSESINEIMHQISKQESRKREMSDNMVLKVKIAGAKILQTDITELRDKLGDMNYRQLMQQKGELKEQEEVLIREKNIALGGQDELERNIAQLKVELNKEIFRSAKKNFISKCAEIAVQEEAIQNLIEYTTALDKAIIEFHEERMASVNKIILNLWELIYKGKDTTAIQIHTESTGGMGEKRRTYNYKVVQEKQKVTMDMRGRCSAGQKVLASIIIRMALAETFAKSCGVFALDEPTTNLDQNNMMSLAEALTTIVKLRSRHQNNFQLIVITHDEQFISRLTRVNKIRNVWELYRNEVGLTKVKKWCINDNGMTTNETKDEESSGDEANAETEARSRKRKQLAEERKQLTKKNLSSSPPRKRKNIKTDD